MAPHVCLITNRHWLFDGRVINHARALCQSGFQVTIADCGRPLDWYRTRAPQRDPAEALPAGCRVHRITDATESLPRAVQRIVRRQFRWWLHRTRVRQLVALGAAVYQAPDLLTARYSERVAACSGARVVYDIRDLYSAEWEGARGRVRRRAMAQEAHVLRRADARITVCQGLARLVAQRYELPPPHVIRSCRDPVPDDTRAPDLRGALGLDAGTPLLVHSGHSERGRALDALVEIIGMLETAHLALLGQQAGTQAVRVGAATAAVADRVHLLPAVPATEVATFIRSADAAVIYLRPVSLNMRYALPNKFFEAVAAGLPLACSDGEELRPLIEAYELGRLFDPDDTAAAVAAVSAVLRDTARYRRAVKRAAEQLSWGRESEAYVAIYRELVGTPASAGAAGRAPQR